MTQVKGDMFSPEDHMQGKVWGVFYSTHGTALQVAALAGHINIVQTLLEAQGDLPLDNNFPDARYALCSACRGRSVEVLEALLHALPDLPTLVKSGMFMTACRQGRLNVVKRMVDLGAPPNHQLMLFAPSYARSGSRGLQCGVMQILSIF